MPEIKVKLGNEKDLEAYLKKVKRHDQRTLKIHWAKVKSTNKRSSNQWFLTLNRQTPFSSIVAMVPITVLPTLSQVMPFPRYRQGTVFLPTPPGECLAFGECVIDPQEIGQLHSGDEIKIPELPVIISIEPIKAPGKRGWPRGKKRNAKSQESISPIS